jgi:hypothetical protein
MLHNPIGLLSMAVHDRFLDGLLLALTSSGDSAFMSLVHKNAFPPQSAQAHGRTWPQRQSCRDGGNDDPAPALLYHTSMLQVVEEISQPKQGTSETEQVIILDEVVYDVHPVMLWHRKMRGKDRNWRVWIHRKGIEPYAGQQSNTRANCETDSAKISGRVIHTVIFDGVRHNSALKDFLD